jgi:leader peptidase (prepilin peptidase)/N-methyltransferase
MQLHALAEVFATLFGLCVGSFLNVCIARMPEDRSVVRPASHCPACGHSIRPYDNIPVLSWLWLRAQCRDCGSKISMLYPLIELVVGGLFWLLFRRFVPGADALTAGGLMAFGVAAIFVSMLVAMTFIDLRHYIIPDELSIYAVPVGLAGVVLLAELGGAHPVLANGWKDAVLGAFVGGGSLGLIMAFYWVVRREEGMGMGDVKLLMMMGAFLGTLPAIPFILIVSSLAGAAVGLPMAVIGKKGLRAAMPFGPFLAFAAILYVFHGPEIVARHFPGIAFLLQ